MLRFLILGILGAIPGLVVACYQLRIGLGWAFAGSCLGLLCALPSVTFNRTVRLAFAMIVGRHIPGATEFLAPKAEELSVEHQEINDRVFDWVAGKDVEERNAWIVLAGAVFGVIVTAVVGIHDYQSLLDDQPAWLIVPTKQDGFGSMLLVHSLAITAWSTGIAAILFSAAYRRPIGALLAIPLVASISMLIAGSDLAVVMLYAFGTIAIAIGTLVGWIFAPEQQSA